MQSFEKFEKCRSHSHFSIYSPLKKSFFIIPGLKILPGMKLLQFSVKCYTIFSSIDPLKNRITSIRGGTG